MKQNTMGDRIAVLRKEKNMTQADLAERMGVTDKAVSKWERNLSLPDAASLPRLAEIFGITMDELMQTSAPKADKSREELRSTICLILKAVSVAMGVAVTVLTAMKQIDIQSAVSMLGIGLTCAGLSLLQTKN